MGEGTRGGLERSKSHFFRKLPNNIIDYRIIYFGGFHFSIEFSSRELFFQHAKSPNSFQINYSKQCSLEVKEHR